MRVTYLKKKANNLIVKMIVMKDLMKPFLNLQ